ncbi:MAG: hypothetical protein FWF43_10135 [Propionibacteriaceae bacterium]|nr:hypothetical protein [Propionibacteriaceae bacterium]
MEEHRLDGLTAVEKAVAVAIADCVGAWAQGWDVPGSGRQGAPDILLHYPDGLIAALEATSDAGPGVRQRDSILRDMPQDSDYPWKSPGRYTWFVSVREPTAIPELRLRYKGIVEGLEQLGLKDDRSLIPWDKTLSDDLHWVASHSVSFVCPPSQFPGDKYVIVTPEGWDGTIDKRLTGLADAMTAVLSRPVLADHVAKLRRWEPGSPGLERHLFVGLHQGALPYAQAGGLISLAEGLVAPDCEPPTLPEGITHLWFCSTMSPYLVEVSRGRWTFHRAP